MTNIQPMQSDFEQIKKSTEKGKEYWSARELATAFGYSTWQKFSRVLNKALTVAQNRGMDMGEDFNQVVEMVKLGSCTFREVENFHLSRLACLIIAENADGADSASDATEGATGAGFAAGAATAAGMAAGAVDEPFFSP